MMPIFDAIVSVLLIAASVGLGCALSSSHKQVRRMK